MVFQDGTPLTSEDVKYSIEYTIDPAHKATRGPIFKLLSHVVTDGPHRLHVHLKEPFAPWTSYLTKFMGIWPAGSREKYGDAYFRQTPVNLGTGPGIFEEWKPNDYVSFRRNPHYWQKGLPHWDRLVVKVVPEDASRVAFLLAGQADIIGAPPPQGVQPAEISQGHPGIVAGDVRRLVRAGAEHVPRAVRRCELPQGYCACGGPEDDRRKDLLWVGRAILDPGAGLKLVVGQGGRCDVGV